VSRHISCMGVSHEGKYCTKFLNQYSFICSKLYKLYKYNIDISHNKTTGLRNSFINYLKKPMVKSVIYLLFSYQTGYIMRHSRLMIYIPFGCASGNIDPKPGRHSSMTSKYVSRHISCMGCLMKENTVLNF
jgi:hypothetical protein